MKRLALLPVLLLLTSCSDNGKANPMNMGGFWLLTALVAAVFFVAGVHLGKSTHRTYRQRKTS